MRLRSVLGLLAVSSLLAGSCGSPAKPAPEAPAEDPDGPRGLFSALDPPTVERDVPPGLVLRDGPEVPEPGHEEMPFPPPAPEGEGPEQEAEPEPLEVLSWAPKGDEDLVGAVRVTFSQPMVPLAALSDLAREQVPLEITPEPPGRFRWLGTTTVAFEPEGRMPKATDYEVRVPAGTESALGGALEDELTFRFETPPPSLRSSLPSNGHASVELEPTIALCFDQRIEPKTIAASSELAGPGDTELRLLTGEAAKEVVGQHMALQSCEDDRRVVFRTSAPLRKASDYRVRVAAGTKGAEGPKPIVKPIDVRFQTYHPLSLRKVECPGRGRCRPGHQVYARFNNPLAPDQDLAERVTVKPEVPRLERTVVGANVRLSGDFAPRTRYRVTFDPELRDVHGQSLGSRARGTVAFGDAYPYARVPTDDVATLELDTKRALPVELVNVPSMRARVAPVPRERVGKVLELLANGRWRWRRQEDPFAEAGLRPRGIPLRTRGQRNEEHRVGVPLSSAIAPNESGYALAHVEARGRHHRLERYVLVQATDLGVVAHVDHAGAVARVTSLSEGEPVAGAEVGIYPRNWGSGERALATAKTDSEGIARFEHGSSRPVRVVARKGDDEALVTVDPGSAQEQLVGTIFTDRDPYRPGDTVHIRGVARRRDASPAASVHPLEAGTVLDCRVRDRRRQEHAKVDVELSAYGTFEHELELPEDASTGSWSIHCDRSGIASALSGSFRVEEYRAPEIEVEVKAPEGPHFHGDRPTLSVESRYLFGADAAGLPVRYTVGREPTRFSPPGHPGWLFGDAADPHWRTIGTSRWVRRHGRHRMVREHRRGAREIIDSGRASLDDEGRLQLPVELRPGEQEGPARFVLEAEVTDPSRQRVAGRAEVLAHPAAAYAGLKPEKPFVSEDDPIRAGVQLVDVQGEPVAGREVTVRAVERRTRLVWNRDAGGRYRFEWKQDDREVGKCAITSAEQPERCRFAPQRPGRYVLEARATDAEGRETVTTAQVWVFGGRWVPSDDEETVELVPDQESYEAGETARVLVRAPFAKSRGLLSIGRAGATETRPIALDGSLQVIEVPITEAHVPNVHVRVSLARGRASAEELEALLEDAGPDARRAAAKDVGRPAWGSASVSLEVDDASKRLSVDVEPDHEVRAPGAPLGVTVKVREPDGSPADAEVTVMAVDEAVLSLLGYETPDPVSGLHRRASSTLRADSVHGHVVRRQSMRELRDARAEAADREDAAGAFGALNGRGGGGSGSGYGRGAGGLGKRARAPAMARASVDEPTEGMLMGALDKTAEAPASARTLFATTAFYRAAVRTDEQGEAHVRFDLPDNLTTFRLMAVAVGRGVRSGSGQSEVQVRKSVLLRPALPRFATFGDRFEASVVVHNETGEATDVTVGMRAAGLQAEGDAIRELHMEDGEAREVAFPVSVTEGGGVARVQFAAAAKGGSDAVERDLPLNEPATSEAFATYGSVQDGVFRVPVKVPDDVLGRWGRLEVKLSSTALTGLDDAADYLFDYPYQCAEQHASRLVAAAALDDVLAGRNEEGRAEARALAERSIEGLLALQRYDGGFKYWPGSRDATLYVSSWVTFALHEAREAGFEVDDRAYRRALAFLDRRLRNPSRRHGEHRAWAMQAFALFTRAQAGETVSPAHLGRVWRHRGALPLFGKAWLLEALRARDEGDGRAHELWRQIENASVETPSGAHFAEDEVESARLLWHSSRRTDAIVLAVMLEHRPDHPLVEKTARALVAARRHGRWHTTQENAWSLSALVRYYREREQEVPDLVAKAWLGDGFIGETELKGRSGRVVEGHVPMAELQRMGDADLVLDPEGKGRLYYRLGLRYAPAGRKVPPAEQGFSVTRSYEAVDEPDDVRRDDDGTWHVETGKVVRIRLTVVVPDDRYDVAIDDPLPAGLEPVNMAFATTATQRLSGARTDRHYDAGHWWAFFAFEHRELRDDRVVAFARRAPAGVYELAFLARATTPGRFLATGTKAEEMYAPEVFGRAASDLVVVE